MPLVGILGSLSSQSAVSLLCAVVVLKAAEEDSWVRRFSKFCFVLLHVCICSNKNSL